MAALCQELKCLPRPGGLLDQDSLYVYGITAVMEAQAEKEELDKKRGRAHAPGRP